MKKLVQGENILIYIKTTFNNTIFTLTNSQGQVLNWASAGSCGFKGSRKSTAFAAKKSAEIFIKKSLDSISRCSQIKICVSGIGLGRENALRSVVNLIEKPHKQKIRAIREISKIPHNGCRPPKKRRL
nr:30S ribosomal protein S11 [Poropsis sp. ID1_4]